MVEANTVLEAALHGIHERTVVYVVLAYTVKRTLLDVVIDTKFTDLYRTSWEAPYATCWARGALDRWCSWNTCYLPCRALRLEQARHLGLDLCRHLHQPSRVLRVALSQGHCSIAVVLCRSHIVQYR